ncbi:MAG: DUF1810 domain-containing protein [Burkholderiaceae bacterium]
MADLTLFVEAQAPVYATALAELRAGRKQTHWMWFVFPQLKALGRSSTALHYGLHDLTEAQSYWAHPVLGPRLKECVLAVLSVESRTAHDIFGSPDDLKFCSCLTLFERAASEACFGNALNRFYGSRRDEATLELLDRGEPGTR